MKKLKSFTLIELLIVITIIGILAVALVPRISQGPARARDVQRKADLQQVATAMELYYADHGEYPNSGVPSYNCIGESDWIDSAIGDYMEVPTDPNSGNTYCTGENYYYYRAFPYSDSGSTANSYIIVAQMENGATTDNFYCSSTPKLPASIAVYDSLTEFLGGIEEPSTCATIDEFAYYYTYH
jgi:prepilin-type N-terminal cleavage/methylation domain-containing protein